uniref:Uncharacterized protein n=1 Tax=Medicago truncatula TaxID=3880 RepID=I3SP50_MEDTR|nr:unknown [Medicago truncatula]
MLSSSRPICFNVARLSSQSPSSTCCINRFTADEFKGMPDSSSRCSPLFL